jgi:hypothetical protein
MGRGYMQMLGGAGPYTRQQILNLCTGTLGFTFLTCYSFPCLFSNMDGMVYDVICGLK